MLKGIVMKISVCIIVKNESETVERCLESVKPFADEIIVVDTGSVDDTKAKARKFTDKIYDFKWINDFSAARNHAFEKATSDYLFWLDADDVIDTFQIEYRKEVHDGEKLDVYHTRENGIALAKGLNGSGDTVFVCKIEYK